MEKFLQAYGYVALSLGTFLEGETAILVASSLAVSGLFKIPLTVFFGFFGSFLSDWLYFLIGRFNGRYFLNRRPALREKFMPVEKFFVTHRLQILFSYRFLYGFRVIIPVMLGMSDIKSSRFLGYSVLVGLIWATTVSSVGFGVGKLLNLQPSAFEENILYILLGFACFGVTLGYTVKKYAERKMHISQKAEVRSQKPEGVEGT